MKKYDFYFSENWFVFPFAISTWKHIEYLPPRRSIQVHFLWWHFRYIFASKED